MKHFFHFTVALAILTATTFALAAFISPKKTAKAESSSVQMISKVTDEANNGQCSTR